MDIRPLDSVPKKDPPPLLIITLPDKKTDWKGILRMLAYMNPGLNTWGWSMCSRVEQHKNVRITFGVTNEVIQYVESRKGTLHFGMGTVKATIPQKNKPTGLDGGKRPSEDPPATEEQAPKRAKRQRHRNRKPRAPLPPNKQETMDLTLSPLDPAMSGTLSMSNLSLDSPNKQGENLVELATNRPSTSSGYSADTQSNTPNKRN